MSPSPTVSLAGVIVGALALAPVASAQYRGWRPGQVNATMCTWNRLRAHQMRDAIYLDGGWLTWSPGMSTGEYGPAVGDDNPFGLIYKLNLGRAFNVTQNTSQLLDTVSKAPGGGSAANIAPTYQDGALLGDDNSYYLYGGLPTRTDAFTPPDADAAYGYHGFPLDPNSKASFQPGFFFSRLPTNMTRYLAYGGAASAPSEKKAWYFSGQHSPTWGPVYTASANDSLNAINVSNTLITLDLTQPKEKWTNVTLPEAIKGRANPELVWVPYGSQGSLIAIGGVIYPEYESARRKSANAGASAAESKGFTAEVDIYDVANAKWYRQPTFHPGPGAITKGCTVVAYAQDMSSINIYYYGGYDGLDPQKDFSDDVWILSLPSFMWIKASSGKTGLGRAGHKCFKPYPDLMMVIGGDRGQPTTSLLCLPQMIRLFNLTTNEWVDSYDPTKWSKYGVPDRVIDMVGGSPTGGAKMKQPDPSGFASAELSSLFATTYATSKIVTHYPYATSASTDNTNPSLPADGGGGGGSSVPSYVGPVVGVIGGLILLTALIAGFCVYRRRHLLKRDQGGDSVVGTDENGNRIMRWMHGQPSEHKGPPTVTATEETVFTPDMEHGAPIPPKSVQSVPSSMTPTAYLTPYQQQHTSGTVSEMADTQMVELMDTSPRIELQDTGLTPVDIINKHSHFAQQNNNGSIHSSNLYSSIAQTDHASVVTRSTDPPAPSAQPQHGTEASAVPGRPDSPALGGDQGHDTIGELPSSDQYHQDGHQGPGRESAVSGISDRDRRHLRHMSDETVSSFGGGGGVSATQAHNIVSPTSAVAQGQGGNGQHMHPLVGTPPLVSPPEVGEADDYLSARAQGQGQHQQQEQQQQQQQPQRGPSTSSVGSPLRKSVFHESMEDLGPPR